MNESSSVGDEQTKAIETACTNEYRDLSLDRIRRMIRSILKVRKTTTSLSTQVHSHWFQILYRIDLHYSRTIIKRIDRILWAIINPWVLLNDFFRRFVFLASGVSSITDIDLIGIWCWISSSGFFSTISTIVRSFGLFFHAFQWQ